MPAQQPKKGGKVALIVIICVVLLAGLGVGAYFVFFRNADKGNPAAQAEYQTLLQDLSKAKSPAQVAALKSQLDDILEMDPLIVSQEVIKLVDICVDYENARDSNNKYEYMLDDLADLAESTDLPELADCIENLLDAVEDDYDDYKWEQQNASSSEPPSSSSAPSSSSRPPINTGSGEFAPELPDEWMAPLDIADFWLSSDGSWFDMEVTNTSDKTIVEFDVWVFCYDADGEPIDNIYGDNWAWNYMQENIAPGETVYGDWDFDYSYGTVIAVPYISYVEFSDGTTWGYSNNGEATGAMYDHAEKIQPYFDSFALELAYK